MANIVVTVEATVNAPAEAVFDVITDPSKMPSWVKGVESAELQPDFSFEPGSKFHLKYTYGRRTNDITMEVTAAEPTRVEYHTVEGPYPIEAKFKLEPSASGTTIVYTQNALSESKMTAFAFIVSGWLARPMMRKQLRKDMQRLVDLVSSESAPSGGDGVTG